MSNIVGEIGLEALKVKFLVQQINMRIAIVSLKLGPLLDTIILVLA